MLTQEAINKLQHDATAAGVLAASNGHATVIPEDYRLIDLSKYAGQPQRFEGCFETGSIADFIRYANINKQDDSGLFIDANNNSAKFIIDHGTPDAPKHGSHVAVLELHATAAYRALISIHQEKHSQQALAEWVEEWGGHITVEDDAGESMTLAQATAAIRKIEIKNKSEREFEEGESARKVSAMEQIEAKMRGQQPKTLRFTCTPFDGFEPVQAEIRLNVIATKDAPIIATRIIRLETLRESVGQQFKKILTDGIPGIPAYIGDFHK